jgi:hypothetical protein
LNLLLLTRFEKIGEIQNAGSIELVCDKIESNKNKYTLDRFLLSIAKSKKLKESAERNAINSKTDDRNIIYNKKERNKLFSFIFLNR